MFKSFSRIAFFVMLLPLFMAACAGGSTVRTVYTAQGDVGGPIESVLVVGAAGRLTLRAYSERQLVAELKREGIDARAYHAVAPGAQLSRDAIAAAARSEGLDGVVVTREAKRESAVKIEEGGASVKATPKGGNLLNLYRYDYESLNEPSRLVFNFDVSLTTDLYSVERELLIWTGESKYTEQESAELLIDRAARDISKALVRTGLVR